MISVGEAAQRIAGAFAPLSAETVPIGLASGRVLAQDAVARADQPPAPVSSMDGYALAADSAPAPGATLRVIGSAPAGHPFEGTVGPGEAVRIFTGGVVPEGADAIVIQEDADAKDDRVTLRVAATRERHIRAQGFDFKRGAPVLAAGRRLAARDLSLLAAADLPELAVRKKPRIAVAATGDELSRPGEPRKPGGIVASSGYAIAALVTQWGGTPVDLGIKADTVDAVASIAESARDADMIVTLGGASVGDHDLVQKALGPKGFELDFWKIAMRPGKPLIFGRLGQTPLLGLPGNPVSTLVCALLFLEPAIARMLGTSSLMQPRIARAARALAANDLRQDHLRARLSLRDGEVWAEPFAQQDSSALNAFANADCLIVRPPHAPPAEVGDRVEVLLL
jgi:molybdopterin molybdotransferase